MQVAAFFCRRISRIGDHEYQFQAGAIGVFKRAYLPLDVDVALLLSSRVTSPEEQYLSFDLAGADGSVRKNVMKPKLLSGGAVESQQIVPMKLSLAPDLALGRHELRLMLDGQSAFALSFEIDP